MPVVDTTTTSIARIFVSLLVAFSYPLLCNPGRNSMMSLWTSFLNRNKEQKPDRHSISLTLEELQAEDESDQFKFAVTTVSEPILIHASKHVYLCS